MCASASRAYSAIGLYGSKMDSYWYRYYCMMEFIMKTLSIKNVPDRLHRRLKQRAGKHHRSLNGEMLALLEAALDIEDGEADSESLSDFLLRSPLSESGLDLTRDRDLGREFELLIHSLPQRQSCTIFRL